MAHGVPADGERGRHLSPVSTLFAAFLGYDPVQHLIGAHALSQLTPAQQQVLTGRSFFPGLISVSFRTGLHAALDFAIVASLLAAWASWLRGGRYVYTEGRGPESADGAEARRAPTGTAGAGDAVSARRSRGRVSSSSIAQVKRDDRPRHVAEHPDAAAPDGGDRHHGTADPPPPDRVMRHSESTSCASASWPG